MSLTYNIMLHFLWMLLGSILAPLKRTMTLTIVHSKKLNLFPLKETSFYNFLNCFTDLAQVSLSPGPRKDQLQAVEHIATNYKVKQSHCLMAVPLPPLGNSYILKWRLNYLIFGKQTFLAPTHLVLKSSKYAIVYMHQNNFLPFKCW